jgi:hypothetical protein
MNEFEPCTEFTVDEFKGHHLKIHSLNSSYFSVLAVSSRHGLIYHKSIPLDDEGKATHHVNGNNLIVDVENSAIVSYKYNT